MSVERKEPWPHSSKQEKVGASKPKGLLQHCLQADGKILALTSLAAFGRMLQKYLRAIANLSLVRYIASKQDAANLAPEAET